MPPCNKTGISNFSLEFQKFQEFQISLKCYSSFSSFLIILNFSPEKLGIWCHPVIKTEFQISAPNSRSRISARNSRNPRNSLLLEIAAPPSVLVLIYLLTINIKLCRWVRHIKTQVGLLLGQLDHKIPNGGLLKNIYISLCTQVAILLCFRIYHSWLRFSKACM